MEAHAFPIHCPVRPTSPDEELALVDYFEGRGIDRYEALGSLGEAHIAVYDDCAEFFDPRMAKMILTPATVVTTIVVFSSDTNELSIFRYIEKSKKVELIKHMSVKQQAVPEPEAEE